MNEIGDYINRNTKPSLIMFKKSKYQYSHEYNEENVTVYRQKEKYII